VIASVVEYKKLLRELQAWLLPGTVGILALIGLVMLFSELRNAARARKRERDAMRFPDRKDRFRKAG